MILVTGGTGLVGSHLLLKLLESGKKVRATHRKDSDLKAVHKIFSYYHESAVATSFYDQIEWVEADLNDIPALSIAFQDIIQVYHCAAMISFDSSNSKELRKTNITGTANIVNLAISYKIEKLCYISSISTLDLELGGTKISENFTWYPEKYHSEYAISKHGAEIEVWRASQESLPVIIINPGVIIGPGFWNDASGLLFKRVAKGLNYHFPKVTGFVGVKDVVKLSIKAMDSSISNEHFIAVSENLSFREVLDYVAKSLKKTPPKIELNPWMVTIGWIFQSIGNTFFGMKRQLSSRDHKALFEASYYENEKSKRELNFEYTPIQKVIEETSSFYLLDKNR